MGSSRADVGNGMGLGDGGVSSTVKSARHRDQLAKISSPTKAPLKGAGR